METVRSTENTEDNISLWQKCTHCGEVTFRGELVRNSFTCPKCKKLFVISIENRIKLFLKDHTSNDETVPNPDDINNGNTNQIDVISIEENIEGYEVSLYILQPETTLEQRHIDVFTEAITIALTKSIPLLSVFTANPTQTQCSIAQIVPLMIQLEALAEASLPHITVLTETDVTQLTTYLPVGEIVIAECEASTDNIARINPQPALHAPEEQLLPEKNREITPDISVDCYVPRTELHTMLVKLLKFFADRPISD